MRSASQLDCRSLFTVTLTLLLTLSVSVAAAAPVAVAPEKKGVVVEEERSAVRFSLALGAGYLTGEANEIVYWPEFDNHKASELTWEINSLYMIGLDGGLDIGEWFTLSVTGWFKATDGDGTMDDYDWQVVGGDWTDWSHHEDTDVTTGSIIDINAAFGVVRVKNFRLNLIGGFKRDNFGWEARGGDYLYSVNSFRDTSGSIPDGTKGVSYEQEMTSLYGGVGIVVTMDRFQFSGRFIYSPFVQGESTDTHHLRNLVIYDDFENGDMFSFNLAGEYSFTPNLSLELAFLLQDYDTVQGDSEWHFQDEGVVYYVEDGAGMDHSSSMLQLMLRYTF